MTEPGEIQKRFVDVETRIRSLIDAVRLEVQSRTEERTPVVTGELKASWHSEMTSTGFRIQNIAPYAKYVEDGTPFMAPRHMLATTIVEMPQIVKQCADKLGIKK